MPACVALHMFMTSNVSLSTDAFSPQGTVVAMHSGVVMMSRQDSAEIACCLGHMNETRAHSEFEFCKSAVCQVISPLHTN